MNARIKRISGALADVAPMKDASLYELVRVGERALMGEVVRIDGEVAVVQVFEETSGLMLGEPVERTKSALTAELGPGLMGSILDGVGRPLVRIAEATGSFIAPGTSALTLDRARRFTFQPAIEVGTYVEGGDVLGTVEERPGFVHRIMVPPAMSWVSCAAARYGTSISPRSPRWLSSLAANAAAPAVLSKPRVSLPRLAFA